MRAGSRGPARAAAHRHRLRGLVDPDAVRARTADRRHRLRPRPGRQRRRQHRLELAEPDLDRDRRCSPSRRAAYMAAVFLSGDADRDGRRELAERFRTRALAAGVVAGAVAIGGHRRPALRRPPALHRLTQGAGLPALVALAARRASRRSRSSGGGATSLRATAPRSPSRRRSPAGRSPRTRSSCAASPIRQAAARPRHAARRSSIAVLAGARDPLPVARAALPAHARRSSSATHGPPHELPRRRLAASRRPGSAPASPSRSFIAGVGFLTVADRRVGTRDRRRLLPCIRRLRLPGRSRGRHALPRLRRLTPLRERGHRSGRARSGGRPRAGATRAARLP